MSRDLSICAIDGAAWAVIMIIGGRNLAMNSGVMSIGNKVNEKENGEGQFIVNISIMNNGEM